MKRWLLILVLAALTSACAAQAGGTTGGPNSGIRGRAMAGPTCPVERSDSPCPDRPVTATVVVTDASGKQVARVPTAADGRFTIRLAPGSYVVRGERAAGLGRLTAPMDVTVRAGQFTSVTLTFDTGIR